MPGPIVKENPPASDSAGSTDTKPTDKPTDSVATTPPSQPAAAGLPPRQVDPVIPSPAEAAPIVSGGAGTAISTNDGRSVVMPTVSYMLPPVQGQRATDRGDDAEFVVLHTRFGRHIQGSRISLDDVANPADVDKLIELGAIAPIGPDGQPLSREQLAAEAVEKAGK